MDHCETSDKFAYERNNVYLWKKMVWNTRVQSKNTKFSLLYYLDPCFMCKAGSSSGRLLRTYMKKKKNGTLLIPVVSLHHSSVMIIEFENGNRSNYVHFSPDHKHNHLPIAQLIRVIDPLWIFLPVYAPKSDNIKGQCFFLSLEFALKVFYGKVTYYDHVYQHTFNIKIRRIVGREYKSKKKPAIDRVYETRSFRNC